MSLDVNEKIRVTQLELNLVDSPEDKERIRNRLEILQHQKRIEQIKDKVKKLRDEN